MRLEWCLSRYSCSQIPADNPPRSASPCCLSELFARGCDGASEGDEISCSLTKTCGCPQFGGDACGRRVPELLAILCQKIALRRTLEQASPEALHSSRAAYVSHSD